MPKKKVVAEGWAKFIVTKEASGHLKIVALLQDEPGKEPKPPQK